MARLVSQGLTNAEIAGGLHVALATVKTHVSALLDKTGTSNRVQLAIAVLEMRDDPRYGDRP